MPIVHLDGNGTAGQIHDKIYDEIVHRGLANQCLPKSKQRPRLRVCVRGRMLATILDSVLGTRMLHLVCQERELADVAARELKALGGHPTFKGYQGFPDVICISVNDKVVHGIPRRLCTARWRYRQSGFGVTYRGMVTDSARTFLVGSVDEKVKQLVAETKKSLDAGIATLHDGVTTGDIGAAQRVLDIHHYGIVRDLVGHGVGIINYTRNQTSPTTAHPVEGAVLGGDDNCD